jgi:hypothetical protein
MHYNWQCPKVQEFWQQVGRWLEEIFEIPIQLNIENTVFNTNMDEFPYEIINFVLLFAFRTFPIVMHNRICSNFTKATFIYNLHCLNCS